MACSQLQGNWCARIWRNPSGRTNRFQRGKSGTGAGPRYAQIRPPISCTGYALILILSFSSIRRLERLVEATAFRVEQPAVIAAAQAALVGDAEMQARAAMRAALLHEAELAAAVAEQREILAENAHLAHRVLPQQRLGIDRMPIAAHELAARRAGAYARE